MYTRIRTRTASARSSSLWSRPSPQRSQRPEGGGGSRLHVVGGLATPAHMASAQAGDQLVVGHGYENDVVQRPSPGRHVVQHLGLEHVPGEPVQQVPLHVEGGLYSLQHHRRGNLVWYEQTAVHVFAGLDSQGSTLAPVMPEQVSGAYMGYAQDLGHRWAWVPFPGPRRAQDDQPLGEGFCVSAHFPRLPQEAFVVSHQELGLKLPQGIQGHSHHDKHADARQQRGLHIRQQRRGVGDNGDESQVERPPDREPEYDPVR